MDVKLDVSSWDDVVPLLSEVLDVKLGLDVALWDDVVPVLEVFVAMNLIGLVALVGHEGHAVGAKLWHENLRVDVEVVWSDDWRDDRWPGLEVLE